MYEVFLALLTAHRVDAATVCKNVGVSQSTISNWKNRHNLISADIGLKLAAYFGVSLDYLYTGAPAAESHISGDPPAVDGVLMSPSESALVRGFRRAVGPVRKAMLDMANDALEVSGARSAGSVRDQSA